jgi:hypothetical protein
MKPLDTSQSPKPGEKKPYRRPALQVYGDLRTITNHVGNVGMTRDSRPHMGNFKTR